MHKLSVCHNFDCSSVHRAKASLTKASLPCRTVAAEVFTSNSQSLALQRCTTRRERLLVLPSKLNYSELQLRHSRSRDFVYQALPPAPLIFHLVQRSTITLRARGGDEATCTMYMYMYTLYVYYVYITCTCTCIYVYMPFHFPFCSFMTCRSCFRLEDKYQIHPMSSWYWNTCTCTCTLYIAFVCTSVLPV